MLSKTRAALSVQTRGKNSPDALANPAIVPELSLVLDAETANTVPLVPSDTTTSPASAKTPKAAAALSPAPAPILSPLWLVSATSVGATTRGRIGKCPRQYSITDCSYCELEGLKYPVPEASEASVVRADRSGPSSDSPAGPYPARRQVSQSCGKHTAATFAALLGSFCFSQRSFVEVKEATGNEPVSSAIFCAPKCSAI